MSSRSEIRQKLEEVPTRHWACVAGIGLFLVVGAFYFPEQQANQYPDERAYQIAPQGESSDDRIADYTLGLEVFTALLVIVSGWQGYLILRAERRNESAFRISRRQAMAGIAAAKAAQKAADAADRSATTAMGVEIPYLRALSLRNNVFSADRRNWIANFSPVIEIKNFGRTPAFVSEIIVNARVGIGLPKDPVFTRLNKYPKACVIESKETYTHESFSFVGSGGISQEEIESFLIDKDEWIYVYGIIKFTDFLGNPHEQGFVFVWVPKSGNWIVPFAAEKYQAQK